MNIPDDALEAAAKALFEDNYAVGEREVWEVPAIRAHYLHIAKVVLDTAAPRLLRDAWQAGNDSCWSSPNPYKEASK